MYKKDYPFDRELDWFLKQLPDYMDKHVTESERFTSCGFWVDVFREHIDEFGIRVENDGAQPKVLRHVTAVATIPETGYRMVHYIFKGTKSEILDYLRDENFKAVVLEEIDSLNTSIGKRD